MRIKEARKLKQKDILAKIKDLEKSLTTKKMLLKVEKIGNTSELSMLRKSVARLKTVYREKENV